MISRRVLALLAVTAASTVVLAGCGQKSVAHHTVAADLLSHANSSAAHTSFAISLQAQARIGLSGVSGLSASELQELQTLRTELNAVDVSGTIDYQDSSRIEGSIELAPLLAQPVRFIEVGGVEYVSDSSSGWQRAQSPKGSSQAAPPSPAAIPSWVLSLGTLAKQETTVTKLGKTTIDGSSVEHLRAVVSGAGLEKIFQAALVDLGTAEMSPTEASELAGLIQFGTAQGDSYLLAGSGLPARESASAELSLNLSALSLLDPTEPAASGTVSLNLSLQADFSRYGADFGITAPSSVAPGPARVPSGISQLF